MPLWQLYLSWIAWDLCRDFFLGIVHVQKLQLPQFLPRLHSPEITVYSSQWANGMDCGELDWEDKDKKNREMFRLWKHDPSVENSKTAGVFFWMFLLLSSKKGIPSWYTSITRWWFPRDVCFLVMFTRICLEKNRYPSFWHMSEGKRTHQPIAAHQLHLFKGHY